MWQNRLLHKPLVPRRISRPPFTRSKPQIPRNLHQNSNGDFHRNRKKKKYRLRLEPPKDAKSQSDLEKEQSHRFTLSGFSGLGLHHKGAVIETAGIDLKTVPWTSTWSVSFWKSSQEYVMGKGGKKVAPSRTVLGKLHIHLQKRESGPL